jgi:hypothetical protein
MGMAYNYQLSKIQLLPITRLEAILSFWEFAEKNNLELIAYSLSQKSLATIEPSNELSEYGAAIVKAYARNGNFDRAEKWLLFSENSSGDLTDLHKLQSAKLLLSLFKLDESSQFIDILLKNLQNMEKNSVNNNDQVNTHKNEILFVIFSLLNTKDQNPFNINRKVDEPRLIPSAYIMNNIRNCINNNNHAELLLSIIVSLDGKNWTELHPEHLRLIIIALQEYKNGFLLNNIIMEILEQNKII